MIVPHMTYDEICKEILKDMDIILRKYKYILTDLQRIATKTHKEIKNETIKYTTPNKNTYILLFLHVSKKDHTVVIINYHYTDTGIRAVIKSINASNKSDMFNFYNGHLFTRYNERLKLNLNNSFDIMVYYFSHNFFTNSRIDCSDSNYIKLFSKITDGIILGRAIVENKINVFNTFISNDLLFDEQSKNLNTLDNNFKIFDYYFKEEIAKLQKKLLK